jgi:hypothetical protein
VVYAVQVNCRDALIDISEGEIGGDRAGAGLSLLPRNASGVIE